MIKIILLGLCLLSGRAQALTDGVRYDTLTARNNSFQVVELDLKAVDLKLYWKKPDGTPFETLTAVRDFVKPNGTFVMATNSGIYGDDGAPLGLHIERGKMLQKLNRIKGPTGNFYMIPNGVFFVTANGAQVVSTDDYAKLNPKALEATQSGPYLLRQGKIHPRFHTGSGNNKIRSGVGVNTDSHVVFAESEDGVGFY